MQYAASVALGAADGLYRKKTLFALGAADGVDRLLQAHLAEVRLFCSSSACVLAYAQVCLADAGLTFFMRLQNAASVALDAADG